MEIKPEELARLLGPDLVAAIERRGIFVADLDFGWVIEKDGCLDFSSWYKVSKGEDRSQFCTVRLPLFVRLLRAIEAGEGSVESNVTAMAETMQACEEWSSLANAQLAALLISRVAEACIEHRPGACEDLLSTHLALATCLRMAERLAA